MRFGQLSRREWGRLIGGGFFGGGMFTGAAGHAGAAAGFREKTSELLRDWCEALVALQIDEPANRERHGALRCPACGSIHGRCSDAAYPLMAVADSSGDMRFQRAALGLMAWSKNVDAPDGAWTNELDPKSWKGTTVFGAIALADAVQRHGRLFDPAVRDGCLERLRRAGGFIRANIDMSYGNVNYGFTAMHALVLLGPMLGEPEWTDRARELAKEGLRFISPEGLIYGEGRPFGRISAGGCRPVDLGYNVEETLPALLHYAELAKDRDVRSAAVASLATHLAFMLPDGAWDNSWGTRSYKWTYWGSRTTDGCIPALLLGGRPEFLSAAERHLDLLRRCTRGGLLYGGPHLAEHGAPPCVHHTFTHAKGLADALHIGVPETSAGVALPREAAGGVREFREIGTWLIARGPYRATVTRNDWLYAPNTWHASGGSLALLWHRAVGPLFAASLAEYVLTERNNMQPSPDSTDFPLTPRVEQMIENERFSTMCDLGATVRARAARGADLFEVDALLANVFGKSNGVRARLNYRFADGSVEMGASVQGGGGSRLVLPLVCGYTEEVQRAADNKVAVRKNGATVMLEANAPLAVADGGRTRIFNLVPGFLAVPISIAIPEGRQVKCRITVSG
jgi:hypothetical protein